MARETLTPDQTAELSIFQLPKVDGARLSEWFLLLVLGAAALIGTMAYLGPFRPTPISRFAAEIAPLQTVYVAMIGVAILAALLGAAARDRGAMFAGAMTVAYLAGFSLYGYIHAQIRSDFDIPFRSMSDAEGFILFRLAFGAGIAAPMVLVWLIFSGRIRSWLLGLEYWFVRSRSFSANEKLEPWAFQLVTGYLAFVLVFAALMQAGVSFGPILSGTFFALLSAVLLASLVNAAVEETIFRGLLQPAFIAAGGVAAGLWIQGALFGLVHWGMTVGALAALPMALAMGFGSIIWGKAAYETRGLAWPIAAHFMVDVAIMAAFFVPRG